MTNTMRTDTTTDRLLVALLLALAVLTIGAALVHGATTTIPGRPAPAPAPTDVQVQAPPVTGDLVQVADKAAPGGALVYGGADLDMSQIDDLRSDPYGQCVSHDGVLTPAGECVDAVTVWRNEMSPGSWSALLDQGYLWDSDDQDAMWIPAQMVILGGEGGEDVLAVNPGAPLS